MKHGSCYKHVFYIGRRTRQVSTVLRDQERRASMTGVFRRRRGACCRLQPPSAPGTGSCAMERWSLRSGSVSLVGAERLRGGSVSERSHARSLFTQTCDERRDGGGGGGGTVCVSEEKRPDTHEAEMSLPSTHHGRVRERDNTDRERERERV